MYASRLVSYAPTRMRLAVKAYASAGSARRQIKCKRLPAQQHAHVACLPLPCPPPRRRSAAPVYSGSALLFMVAASIFGDILLSFMEAPSVFSDSPT
eukprot:594554-Rhodomonas_salina.1